MCIRDRYKLQYEWIIFLFADHHIITAQIEEDMESVLTKLRKNMNERDEIVYQLSENEVYACIGGHTVIIQIEFGNIYKQLRTHWKTPGITGRIGGKRIKDFETRKGKSKGWQHLDLIDNYSILKELSLIHI